MIVGIFEEEKESSSSLFQRYKPCRYIDGLYKVSGVCVFTLNGGNRFDLLMFVERTIQYLIICCCFSNMLSKLVKMYVCMCVWHI